MLAALEQKILPNFMAQGLQRVQLLVIVLGATAHASFRDLAQPFRTVAWCIDLRACTRNGPAPIQCLHAIHDAPEILADGQIAARQFFQCSYAILSVVDLRKRSIAQQLGWFLGIDPVALVAYFQQGILAWI